MINNCTKQTSFFRKFLSDPSNIGAIAPSSRYLAREMIRFVGKSNHILEVGPGTGAITTELVEVLSPSSNLDIIEFDADFHSTLRAKFSHFGNVHVYLGSFTEWDSTEKYDCIISSLPLNALPYEVVAEILHKYQQLLKPSGIISYYEYLWFPHFKKWFLRGRVLQDYLRSLALMQKFSAEYEFEQKSIWANIPPARVHHCQMS